LSESFRYELAPNKNLFPVKIKFSVPLSEKVKSGYFAGGTALRSWRWLPARIWPDRAEFLQPAFADNYSDWFRGCTQEGQTGTLSAEILTAGVKRCGSQSVGMDGRDFHQSSRNREGMR
jgi:hypothetical protein